MEDLNAENWFSSGKPGQTEVAEEAIVERISDSMLQIEATLAETTITLRDLSKLDVGDLLTTDRLANRPFDRSTCGLIGWPIGCSIGRSVDSTSDQLVDRSIDRSVDRPICHLSDRPTGRSVG